MDRIDRLAIDTLRTLSVEEIQSANSGHPGIALGAAPILYTLYSKVLKVNPRDPTKDKIILNMLLLLQLQKVLPLRQSLGMVLS